MDFLQHASIYHCDKLHTWLDSGDLDLIFKVILPKLYCIYCDLDLIFKVKISIKNDLDLILKVSPISKISFEQMDGFSSNLHIYILVTSLRVD